MSLNTEPAGAPAEIQLAILLAEDNAVNQTVALGMLRKLGFHADLAINGTEAITALRKRAYRVVLMDVQMPELDGCEATEELREMLPIADQPWVIALTANVSPAARDRCFAAGMDDYIPKPVRLADMKQALQRAVEALRSRESRQGKILETDSIP